MREFEARFPWLSSWFGDRLDIELPAFLVSLTVHGLLLVSLAFVGYRVHQEVQRNDFKSEVVDNLVSSESTFQDLDQSDNPPPLEAAAGSFAPTLATTITAAPSSVGGIPVSTASADTTHGMAPELVKLDVRRATEVVVPTANYARADRLDPGQRGRDGRWRRRGRRSDRDRDRTPARARADAGGLGIRRLGQPPGRAAAAGKAHRDGLYPHQPAR